jgi:hypothetical protein
MVVHTCNPNFWRDGLEGSQFEASPGKKVAISPSQPIKKAGCGGAHLSSQLHKKHK